MDADSGKAVQSVSQAATGQLLETWLYDGRIHSRVESAEPGVLDEKD